MVVSIPDLCTLTYFDSNYLFLILQVRNALGAMVKNVDSVAEWE